MTNPPRSPGDRSSADRAITEYEVLSGPGGRDLQTLAELAALVCGVPNAAINVITSEHQHQVATAGIDPSVCSRQDSMCAAVLGDRRVVVAPDASQDPRFATNPFVTGVIGEVRFYASAPLITPEGITIGRLCVFDTEPHELAQERATVLMTVAERVVDVLELRRRSRQLEESLRELTRTQAELTRSNERLSLFAGQVSHDLRSPLTSVLANAELLSDEPAIGADPNLMGRVTATVDAAHRMAALIEKILGYARIGAELHRAPVPMEQVADDILADLGPAIAARGATVIRTVAFPTVEGDREHLYAVLLNLVSNAVKFVPAGTVPRITLDARYADGSWRFAVSDNGRGVPADRREALFALHARDDHDVEGSGIGLATARHAIEAHGGRIGIEDAPGGGATFWFTVPDAEPAP